MLKSCFFISRIGDAGSPEREFSDKLLKYIVAPVLENCGYETPIRADHITQPGVITTQVFTHLWDDDLVIADLTGGNPNVFYELAVRHVRRKPFVHLVHAGEKIPFDIAPNRTIEFNFDIEKAEKAKTALEAMVRNSEGEAPTVQTPLSLAVDFSTAGRSSEPVQAGVAQLLSMVQEIKGIVQKGWTEDAERITRQNYLRSIKDLAIRIERARTEAESTGAPEQAMRDLASAKKSAEKAMEVLLTGELNDIRMPFDSGQALLEYGTRYKQDQQVPNATANGS
jgi:hypothetical protein